MDAFEPWARTKQDVLFALKTSELGLSQEEVQKRLEKQGFNELRHAAKKSAFQMLAEQFTNFLVVLLIIAAVISFALGEVLDAFFIALIVVINAAFGFIQEHKAENALDALKKLAAPDARVIRSGKEQRVKARLLVPGDVVELEEGDGIPADCRLVETHDFETIESALTGESAPVVKDANITLKEATQVADQANMCFLGTSVAKGRATAVVTHTGMETEFGKIALMVGTMTEERTPLEEKLEVLGKKLGVAAVAISVFIFLAGISYGKEFFKMFFTAVSLLVAAVPEGLPAVVTITLALGVQRMVQKKAVVRRLPAVETLGSTTVICTDKTGTLTENKMSARIVALAEEDISVENDDLATKGEVVFIRAMEISALCNNAGIIEEKSITGSKFIHTGDPTEVALLLLAKKTNITKESLETQFEFVSELSFDSDRKMMSVIYRDKSNRLITLAKGAPEKIIAKSKKMLTKSGVKALSETDAGKLLAKNSELAAQALRVIALAYKPLKPGTLLNSENVENDLIFAGLVGIMDPPRPEVKDAVAVCKEAGIKVVMITGDNALTAKAIAAEIGIIDGGKVINGENLDKMSDEELEKQVEEVRVFARVNPKHKLRIVNALQRNGEIVAMTGDGVNDAPALKKADIGIAMGKGGTEVAREASKMVLLDDNFATIVTAVEEGRKIYDNIAKSVKFLISCNLGEILAILVPTVIPQLFNNTLPLTPVQILWTNVATDSLPALALGSDAGDPNAMKQKPRDPQEEVIGKKNYAYLFGIALVIGGATLLAFLLGSQWGPVAATTMAFSTLVTSQMLYSLSARSQRTPLYKMNLLENKFLLATALLAIAVQVAIVQFGVANQLFDTVALGLVQWSIILGIATVSLIVIEVHKVVRYGG